MCGASDEIRAKKKQQRALCMQARQQLAPEERKVKSARIVQKLLQLPELQKVQVIFSYMSTPDEVDLTGFHEEMRKTGKQIALPISHKGGIMDAWIPFTEEDMVNGKFGIREPDISRSLLIEPEKIGAILVPCVGFDCTGRRLGHGAGYYDRYLCNCRKAVRICVAFDAQELPEIAVEGTDLPMDFIVTESRLLNRTDHTDL